MHKISRRDWQIEQLGITQWSPKHPSLLQRKRESHFSIPMHIRLLIISKKPLCLNNSIIRDILWSLQISLNQVLQLIPDQISMIPKNFHCNVWWIGCIEEISIDGIHIITPELNELESNPIERRTLWRQICAYEKILSKKKQMLL